MSVYAKSIVGAVFAVVIAGVTAWQSATVHGFRLIVLLPVATAVCGALLTYVVPNVPELPAAKAWVSGALAVLTTLSTAVTGLPATASVMTIIFAVMSAFLTWYVPNLPTPILAKPMAARAAVSEPAVVVQSSQVAPPMGEHA